MTAPSFDAAQAHKFFSAQCYNRCWTLLELVTRSVEQDEELVALGHASLWHWRQRSDCSERNIAVAHWMLGRIYATLAQPTTSLHHAERCARLTTQAGLAPFYQGCAHEVLARAFAAAGDLDESERHLGLARQIAETLESEDKQVLERDLDELAAAAAEGRPARGG
ncbi:MAG TPA: hypothetical protein VHM70_24255 [Polyangiaceae bacterium]|jgi:hypothetical protein|nr:hypothetical protein [Polyangiaceae bacterium]